jgi:hypothetical protein
VCHFLGRPINPRTSWPKFERLPAEIQEVTLYSVDIAVGAKEPEAAAALIQFLAGHRKERHGPSPP